MILSLIFTLTGGHPPHPTPELSLLKLGPSCSYLNSMKKTFTQVKKIL